MTADGPRLILNCTRLDYVNSKGLMLLARCQRMAEANNSFFGIASLNSRIIRAVEILGMGKLVKLFPRWMTLWPPLPTFDPSPDFFRAVQTHLPDYILIYTFRIRCGARPRESSRRKHGRSCIDNPN